MSLWDTLFQHLKVKIEEACCSRIFCRLKGANVVSKSAYLEAVKWPQTSGISKCVIRNYVVLEQWLRGAEVTLRRYHMSKGKEKPQQNGRRGETAFRIKPHTCQRHSEGSSKTLCSSGDATESEPDLPLSVSVSCRGTGQQWPAPMAGALSAVDLGMAQALLEEVTIEPPELTQDWGNRLLEGTNKTLCAPGPRKKEQWPYKRLT